MAILKGTNLLIFLMKKHSNYLISLKKEESFLRLRRLIKNIGYPVKKRHLIPICPHEVDYMKKLIMLFGCLLMLLPAYAAKPTPPLMDQVTEHYLQMTYEKFVHLGQEEKNIIIIRTMELMVELESKYNKQTKTSGHSPKRYDQYVRAFKIMTDFLLSEAVAADYQDLGKDYVKLLKKLGPKGCIYAGWVSTIYEDNKGNFYCLHPSVSENAEVKKIYNSANPSSNKCDSSTHITCNPIVFGFKKYEKKSTFCVPVSNDGTGSKSHNAAYSCMKLSLEEPPKDPANQDSKDLRLKKISDIIAGNGDVAKSFNEIHDYIFRACVCEKAPSDITMHTRYRKYIRPHRTCLGMVSSLKSIDESACSELSTKLTNSNYIDFVNQWKVFFTKNNPLPDINSKTFKADEAIEKEYQTIINSPEAQAYCNGEKPKPKPVAGEKKCNILVDDVADNKDKSLAKIAFEGVKETEVDFTWPGGAVFTPDKKTEAIFGKIDKEQSFEIKVTETTGSKSSFTCPVKIPGKTPPPVEKKCTSTVVDLTGDTKQSIATIAFSGIEADKVVVTWPEGKVEKDNQLQALFQKEEMIKIIELDVTVKADNSKFKCMVEIPALKPSETSESCNVTVTPITDDPNKSLAVVTFTDVKEGDAEFSWPNGGVSTTEKPKEAIYTKTEAAQEFKLSATLKSDKTKNMTCEVKIPALGKSDGPKSIYKIEAKADAYKDQDTTIPVKAIIKNDKGEKVSIPDGHKISWTRTGAGVNKIKEVKQDKKDSGNVSDDIDNKQEEVKPLTDGEFATGASISAPRVEADYKVTAHLIDDNGADVAQDDEAIPLLKAKETPRPNNQNNSGGPPRQAPVFQLTPFNTSTQGVQ